MRKSFAFVISIIAITFSVDYIWEGDGIDERKVQKMGYIQCLYTKILYIDTSEL